MGEKKEKKKKDKEKKDKEKKEKKKEEKATVRSAPDGSDNHVSQQLRNVAEGVDWELTSPLGAINAQHKT